MSDEKEVEYLTHEEMEARENENPDEAPPGSIPQWDIPRPYKKVRKDKHTWVEVDEWGKSVRTGEKIEPYVPKKELKSLKLSRRDGKPRKRPNNTKIHPKFRLKSSVIDINTKGDPNGETWGEREPYAAYQWARLAYLNGEKTLNEIADHTGFKRRVVDNWAYQSMNERQCWNEEKKVMQNQAVRAVMKAAKEQCVESIKDILRIVDQKLKSINEVEAVKLTVREVKDLISVATDLRSISDLEQNPKDIHVHVKLTREEVLRKLQAADPLVFAEAQKEDGDPEVTTH